MQFICILDCIEKLKDLQGQAIECPLCQKPTLIPSSGVESLATNLDAVGLGEPERVPDICIHCVRKIYPPRPVTLFCRDCETSYCGSCSDVEHLKPENIRHSIILDSLKTSLKNGSSVSVDVPELVVDDYARPFSGSSLIQPVSHIPHLHSRPSSSQILDAGMIPGILIKKYNPYLQLKLQLDLLGIMHVTLIKLVYEYHIWAENVSSKSSSLGIMAIFTGES